MERLTWLPTGVLAAAEQQVWLTAGRTVTGAELPARVTALAGVDRQLVSGGTDGRLLFWYPGVAEPVHAVVLDGAVTGLAAGGGWLAARDATGGLWLLELPEPGSVPSAEVATLFPATAAVVVAGRRVDQVVGRVRSGADWSGISGMRGHITAHQQQKSDSDLSSEIS